MSFKAKSRLVRASRLVSSLWRLHSAAGTRVALADPFPKGAQAENIKQVGFSSLGGKFGGFKIAIKHTANDKWYLYTGHSFNQGWSIVDVTDPANPRYVKFIPYVTDDKSIITSQVTLHDNLMLTSLNSFHAAEKSEAGGAAVGHFRSGKPQTNRLLDGRQYRRAPQFLSGRQIRLPLDKLSGLQEQYHGDPRCQRPGASQGPRQMVAAWTKGRRAAVAYPEGFHGPVNVSPDGKWASLPYTPDVVNLDISDPTNPKLIGRLHITEPFASVGIQSVHTVLPLWDRKLLYVSSEAHDERCADNGMNFAGMIDDADNAHPKLISIFPTPVPPKDAPYKDFCDKGGRFGPHNVSQEIHNPAIQHQGNLMTVAWFNAGVRIFDISDARLPKEVGYFMPPERPDLPDQAGAHASKVDWSEEIAVDARGYIYMNDDKWGLFILRYTGKEPK